MKFIYEIGVCVNVNFAAAGNHPFVIWKCASVKDGRQNAARFWQRNIFALEILPPVRYNGLLGEFCGGGGTMALSRRLRAVADMVPEDLALADIGTDHGLLLCQLVKTGRIPYGIGVELNMGPLRRAQAAVREFGLESRIEIRQGNGLEPLEPGEAAVVVAAGMGGVSIRNILEAAGWIRQLQCLILQPMTEVAEVRYWLSGHGWQIIEEDAVKEGRKYYQIIKAVPGASASGTAGELSPAEAHYGPVLIEKRHPLLREMAAKDFKILQGILEQMANASYMDEGKSENFMKSQHRQKALWMEDFMEWL
jgi:tRNA (adenine22-N1)-methyltransferase